MRFVFGILLGLSVGTLFSQWGAGPSGRAHRPRAALPSEAAPAIKTPERPVPEKQPQPELRAEVVEPTRDDTRLTARADALVATGDFADALRAADLLRRADRPTDHLEWAFQEAIIRIDRHGLGEPNAETIRALRAVCRNRFAWRREALEAARSLRDRARHEVQVCAADTVEHLRTRVVLLVDGE